MDARHLALVVAATLVSVAGGQARTEGESLTVTGRVVDQGGKPVAGAHVLADNGGSYQVMKEWNEIPWRNWVPDPFAAASTGPFTRRAKSPTGDDGRFRVEGVPPPAGGGWVVVVHPDWATARVDAKGGAKDGVLDVGDVALLKGAAVKATVRTPDGKPVAGASVVVRSQASTTPSGSPSSWASGDEPGDVRVGRTSEDGTCVVRGITPGRLRVASFTTATLPTVVEAEGDVAKVAEVSISLAPGASIRVEAVSKGTRAPVAGAAVRVELLQAGMSFPGPAPLARVLTDENGVASIEGLEVFPEYRVIVVPPDFADDRINHPGAFHVSSTAKPGATVSVALTLPRTLSVSVVDARTKAPLESAKLHAWADWERFDHSGGQAIELSPTWNAATKAYVTPHARPGPWIVTAWAPGHLPSERANVRVEAGEGPSTAVIALAPATASANGRVVERATGRPVAGASLSTYEWVQQMGDGNRVAATSAADGAFRLSSLMGEGFPLRIEVTAEGYVRETATWPEGGRSADLGDLSLQRAATVSGRVTDARGRSLARVGVSLVDFERRERGKGDGWSATTDDSGRFAFTGLPPGRYLLEGQRESSPIRLAEGGTVERDLVR